MIATAAAGQSCFVEDLPPPREAEAYNAKMRALMLAHVPLEYRSSCGLTGPAERAYFDALRAQVQCGDSDAYQQFFGRFLSAAETYSFAVNRTDLRSDEDFALYCQIVARIDLSGAVNADGSVNVENLQTNAPLLQALSAHVEKTRWAK